MTSSQHTISSAKPDFDRTYGEEHDKKKFHSYR